MSSSTSRRIDASELKQLAAGRWSDILAALGGIDVQRLDGQHGPCPKCDGKDRFRAFPDGSGGVICNQCFPKGKKDGISTLMWLNGWEFTQTLKAVADYLGNSSAKDNPARSAKPRPAGKRDDKPSYVTADAAIEAYRMGSPSVVYVYQDRTGKPIGGAARWDLPAGKEIRPFALNCTGWKLEGMPEPRPLYRLPDLISGIRRVYITEGEKCVDAVRSIGLIATTSPSGSKSAEQADWRPLTSVCEVVILPDNDDDGEHYARHVSKILAALNPKLPIKIVNLEGLQPKGDVADWIEDRDSMEGKAIRDELERLADASPATLGDPTSPKINSIRLSNVTATTLRWVWAGIMPQGKLTMLTGDPGLGKSFVTLDITARVTRGDCWPNDTTPTERGAVLLFAAEDDIEDTIRPRLDAAGADVSMVHCIEGVTRYDAKTGKPQSWSFRLDQDLPILESEIKRLAEAGEPIRLIVIDPISCYMGKADSHNNAEVRGALAPLAALAAKYGVAILMVSHLNKSGTGKAVYRTSGSLAFAAAARSVWMVTRDTDDPSRRVMLPVKMNLCKESAGLAYSIRDSYVAWEAEPVQMNADEFLAKEAEAQDRKPDGDGELFRAAKWLREELAEGRVSSKILNSDAAASNISKPTLRRALNNVGAVSRKDKQDLKWYWSLPADSPYLRTDEQHEQH